MDPIEAYKNGGLPIVDVHAQRSLLCGKCRGDAVVCRGVLVNCALLVDGVSNTFWIHSEMHGLPTRRGEFGEA